MTTTNFLQLQPSIRSVPAQVTSVYFIVEMAANTLHRMSPCTPVSVPAKITWYDEFSTWFSGPIVFLLEMNRITRKGNRRPGDEVGRVLKLTNSIIRGVPKKVSLNDIKSTSVNSNTQGPKSFFELANVRAIESYHKSSSGHQNGRKIRETFFWHFILAWLRKRSIFKGHTVEEDGLYSCFYIRI